MFKQAVTISLVFKISICAPHGRYFEKGFQDQCTENKKRGKWKGYKCFKIIVNTQHAFGVKFPFDQWWWKIQIFMINNYKDFTEAYNIAIVNCRFI